MRTRCTSGVTHSSNVVTRFYDVVHGEVEVRNDEIDDFSLGPETVQPLVVLAMLRTWLIPASTPRIVTARVAGLHCSNA